MRRRSPRCFCAIRSTRTPCLFHSAAMIPQHRSAAAFSRLGDSAVTNWRSVASICGSRGFRSCNNFLERLTSGMAGRCYQCRAIRANRQDSLRPRKKLAARSFTPMARPGGHFIRPRIALGRRSHIIRSLPGKAQPPLGGVRGETESPNDTGRGCDTEDSAAPLSLFDGGRHPRDGAAEAHRGHKERHHQRIPLSRTLSGSAGHARCSDYRVHGARFRKPVVPGDQLKIEMNVLSWRGDFCKLEGKATVNGQLAAEATLMCKMVDRDVMTKAQEPAK